MCKKSLPLLIFNFLIYFLLASTTFAQNDYWRAVYLDCQNRPGVSQNIDEKISNYRIMSDIHSRDMAQYLTFLYAYMPQSDLADYDFDFFEQQVKVALEARETFSWGATIPDDIFRHFVVVYRVNNENLDTARSYIFHQLKDRIKDMSMYDAALEVNHWCHEYVDYQPADVRTSAPLATLRTSHGRCGEESTLTVTALRAVGIPARQCYTPRWAHCDDNHAWVEVWVDGKWWFLGACEPDPALNMGWFAYPATRTMMVHTNVFGRYEGPEEVNKKTQYYSCINVLSNYADTITAYVHVYDRNYHPVKDATVCFKLYNYAEYYTLAEVKTDVNGCAKLNTGLGDLLIWAKKGDEFVFDKLDLREQNHLVLELGTGTVNMPNPYGSWSVPYAMKPPVGKQVVNNVSVSQQAACSKRLAQEDKMREAYRATFPTEAWVKANLKSEYFTDEELYDIVHRSEGNYPDVIKFLQRNSKKVDGLYLKEYVNSLADKDLRDTPDELLYTNMRIDDGRYPKDVFIKGLLSPRISNELLRYGGVYVYEERDPVLGESPSVAQLRQYTLDSIVVDPECNYYNCPISPNGVMWLKRADAHSRDIFFVAFCREYNIPAYLDNASNKIYAWENGEWQEVSFEEAAVTPSEEMATLTLHNPKGYTYYVHYTLQRFENGEYVSYDFENDPRVEKEHVVLNLPAGNYCLSTGNRYSDGEVISHMEFFTLKAKERKDMTVSIPDLVPRNNTYGHLDMNTNKLNNKSLLELLKESGKDKIILCLVAPGTEPTNHLAKELAAKKADYEAWGGKVLLVPNNNEWKPEKNQPANVEVVSEKVDDLTAAVQIALKNAAHDGSLSHTTGERPVCLILNKDGNILFVSEGYHIGLGDLLLEGVK